MDFSEYNLTPSAKKSLQLAKEKEDSMQHLKVIDIHLFWAVLQIDHSVIDFSLESNHLLKSGFVKAMEMVIAEYKEPKRKKKIYSPEILEILNEAKKLSKLNKDEFIGIDHIFVAILKVRKEIIDFLSGIGVDVKTLKKDLLDVIKNGIQPQFAGPAQTQTATAESVESLENWCENINQKISERNTFEIFGRDKEIERAFEILLRKNKRNVIFVGDAGVGKTAIVEGMVEKIIKKECPEILKNKKIYSLDMTSILSGTIYRGQMEEKIKNILKKISEDGDCILFIDEIHTIIGAGSSEGSLDMANILKPAQIGRAQG